MIADVAGARCRLREAIATFSLEPTKANEAAVEEKLKDFETAVKLEKTLAFYRRFEVATRERAA